MKNKLFFAAMLAMILALGMTVVGCKDEPDDNNNNSNGDLVTPTSINVNGTLIELGSPFEKFVCNRANSSLSGFSEAEMVGGRRVYRNTASCGFSVTAGSNAITIDNVCLTPSTGSNQDWYYINVYVPNGNSFTSGQQVTLTYTPNGTHIFKDYEGKTLGAFTLTKAAF